MSGYVWSVCCYYQALRAWSHHGGCQSFPGITFGLQAKTVWSSWRPYRTTSGSESPLFLSSHRGTFSFQCHSSLQRDLSRCNQDGNLLLWMCPQGRDCSLFSAVEGWVTATWCKEVWLGHVRCSNAVWLVEKSSFPWKGNNDWTIVFFPCSLWGLRLIARQRTWWQIIAHF